MDETTKKRLEETVNTLGLGDLHEAYAILNHRQREIHRALEKDARRATIAATNIPDFVAAADTVEAALDRIRAMAVEVDIATTNAFRTGGSSQLSSTGITSGGHTSVGEPS